MTITIIYDNEVFKEGLDSDWGFSCIIEKEDSPTVLFDTGANGSILLSNMKKLGIDPSLISEVFISHNHWDHTGGLSDFLKLNKKAKVYIPFSMPKPDYTEEVIAVREYLCKFIKTSFPRVNLEVLSNL